MSKTLEELEKKLDEMSAKCDRILEKLYNNTDNNMPIIPDNMNFKTCPRCGMLSNMRCADPYCPFGVMQTETTL